MSDGKTDIHMEELAKRMVALDDRAYGEFANIFGPRFRALFLARGLTLSDAEDLAVSAVTDIALKVEKYRPMKAGSFAAWVFALARHTLADWFRRHRGKQQAEVPLFKDVPTKGRAAYDLEPNMDIVLAVQDGLAQLSETDRDIIQLHDLGGEHTYAEISERLHMQAGTVKVRHFRALRQLEAVLENDSRIKKLLRLKKSANRGRPNE